MAPGGYAWWYVDALSADGRHGLTLIAFIDGVFSPYYALARRRGAGDPLNHCAVNVALYGAPRRWAMTERRRGAVTRDAATLSIGRSALRWDGDVLTIDIDEVTAPLPSRLRGQVRVRPLALTGHAVILDGEGRHRWSPLAPRAQVEVALSQPGLRWSGPGYLDTNDGDEPLEASFRRWNWSRAHLGEEAAILYESERRDGGSPCVALRIDRTGRVESFAPPPPAKLPATRLWRMERQTRAEGEARVLKTFEDAPFYSRSMLDTHLLGRHATAVHESLSLDRFRNPAVQTMLAFRMPRALG